MNIVKILGCLFFAGTISTQAQYTEIINSNRPGTSQGAFAVGTGVIQGEIGAGKGTEKHSLLKTKTNVFSMDYALRYGLLLEQLEINFTGTYLAHSIENTMSAVTQKYKISNFRNNTLGIKYLVYDPYKKRDQERPNLYSWKANNSFRWRELIPAVSVYAGANFDTKDNPFLPLDNPAISPKFMIATQNNLEGGWVFVTNFIYDRMTSDYPTFSYILTLTHAINEKISVFVENQGIKNDFYADQLVRFGGAYLFTTDLQIDALATLNFKDTPTVFMVGLGLSYRYDMHTDKIIEDTGTGGKEKKRKKRKDDFSEDNLQNDDDSSETGSDEIIDGGK